MNTVTHLLFAAVARKPLKKQVDKHKNVPPLRTSALLLGAIIPDALLTIISIVCIGIDMSRGTVGGPGSDSLVSTLFSDWFFNNPWVISAQMLFHSPLMVAVFIAIGYFLWKRGIHGGGWFFWLSCSAMVHTLVDIPVHYDDGPLLLWPLNWDIKFYSPISYWDSAHFGIPTGIYDFYLDLAFIGILLARWRGRLLKNNFLWAAIFIVPIIVLSILQVAGVFDRFI